MSVEHQSDDRFGTVDAYIRRVHGEQDQLIQVLHVAQDVFGCLSPEILLHVARGLRLPPSAVLGVATFYHLFRFDPPGDHVATVCTGTACFVKGSDAIVFALGTAFGVAPGETTADRTFTLGTARCIGSCGQAPVCIVDGAVHGHQDPPTAVAAVRDALGQPAPATPAPDPATGNPATGNPETATVTGAPGSPDVQVAT